MSIRLGQRGAQFGHSAVIWIKDILAHQEYDGLMVVVLANNEYTLYVTPGGDKLLVIGRKHYLWQTANDGHMTLTRITPRAPGNKALCRGNYWLFDVIHNRHFTPGVHLSMVTKPGVWEAFLLSPGLPAKLGEQSVIEPTPERIAKPSRHRVSA